MSHLKKYPPLILVQGTRALVLLILTMALPFQASRAGEAGQAAEQDHGLQTSKIGADVVVQAEFYGDEAGVLPTSFGKGAFGLNNFSVRHAALVVEGKLGRKVDFTLEAGTATCVGGGGFSLMEAACLYRLTENWRAGLFKGHILRGFSLHDECIETLTAEKPLFAGSFAPCHPTGVVLEYNGDLGSSTGLEFQAALLNGEGGAIEGENDINLGCVIRTLSGGQCAEGSHEVHWDGCDDRGARLSSGLYFYLLDTEQGSRRGKMVMLK